MNVFKFGKLILKLPITQCSKTMNSIFKNNLLQYFIILLKPKANIIKDQV